MKTTVIAATIIVAFISGVVFNHYGEMKQTIQIQAYNTPKVDEGYTTHKSKGTGLIRNHEVKSKQWEFSI